MKEITEVVFVLDMSGSMHHLTDDTIGGFNSFIEKQKDPDRETLVTTVLFNTETKILHDRVSIEKIEPMTRRDYRPCGGTALLDAVGETVDRVELIQDHLKKEDVPKHTVFAITTDGEENSSTKYDYETIKKNARQSTKRKGLGSGFSRRKYRRGTLWTVYRSRQETLRQHGKRLQDVERVFRNERHDLRYGFRGWF